MIRDTSSLSNTAGNCWALHPTNKPCLGKPYHFGCGHQSDFKACNLFHLLLQFRNKNSFQEWFGLKIHSVKRLARKTPKVGDHLRRLGWHKEKLRAWQRVKLFSLDLLSALCSPGMTKTCRSLCLRQTAIFFSQSPVERSILKAL